MVQEVWVELFECFVDVLFVFKGLVFKLVQDVIEVVVFIFVKLNVFDEKDLFSIVEIGEQIYFKVIFQCESVLECLFDMIVWCGDDYIVVMLVCNEGVQIFYQIFEVVLECVEMFSVLQELLIECLDMFNDIFVDFMLMVENCLCECIVDCFNEVDLAVLEQVMEVLCQCLSVCFEEDCEVEEVCKYICL